MHRFSGFILRAVLTALSVLVGSMIACAQGGPSGGGQHVAVSLVGETRNVVPGQPLNVALRQQIAPGWHTYWRNPGESGLPTTIDWSLPTGFTAGPIQWPTPERFVVDPVVGYGYHDDVLLPVTIAVPANLRSGTTVSLSAHVSWLACSDICIPEEADLRIAMPVGTVLQPDPDTAAAFAAARARMPSANPFPTTATVAKDDIILHVAAGDATRLRDVAFYPADENVVDESTPQSVAADSEGLVLTLRRDTSQARAVLNGVLVFRDTSVPGVGVSAAIAIAAPLQGGTGRPASLADSNAHVGAYSGLAGLGLITALLLAVAGGMLLNLMPCVLPVLSIKVFALVQHAQASPREMRLQGLAYAAGVLASFAVVGGTLVALRATGSEIGWGFQLQSPVFVTLMIYLLFAVGLNLSGVFEIGGRMTGLGSNLALREGYAGSFWTGALATVVATPCTAPFMAAAIGYAITQPWFVSLLVLEAIGLGLALPYLIISFSPQARRLLPKPGLWMLRLKQFLAFPVYGTAVWLMYVLAEQVGASATTVALAGLVLIGFAAWLYDAAGADGNHWRGLGFGVSATAVAGACALVGLIALVDDGTPSSAVPAAAAPAAGAQALHWQPFSEAAFEALRAEGKPVFIDFTAAWCITCKVNERIALADPAVTKAFADADITALRADWTRQDAGITRMLEANGRAGVPLYLFYPKAAAGEPRSPVVLPQLLTAASVLREIREE